MEREALFCVLSWRPPVAKMILCLSVGFARLLSTPFFVEWWEVRVRMAFNEKAENTGGIQKRQKICEKIVRSGTCGADETPEDKPESHDIGECPNGNILFGDFFNIACQAHRFGDL